MLLLLARQNSWTAGDVVKQMSVLKEPAKNTIAGSGLALGKKDVTANEAAGCQMLADRLVHCICVHGASAAKLLYCNQNLVRNLRLTVAPLCCYTLYEWYGLEYHAGVQQQARNMMIDCSP